MKDPYIRGDNYKTPNNNKKDPYSALIVNMARVISPRNILLLITICVIKWIHCEEHCEPRDLRALVLHIRELRTEFERFKNDIVKQLTDLNSTMENEVDQLREMIPQCPVPWVLFEGHCYLFSKTRRNWTDSRDYCRGLGAELVDIYSDAENTFVRDKATDLALAYTWIGIGNLWGSNTWTNGQSVTYQVWFTGQPDGGTTQNCVAISRNDGFGWRNLLCNQLHECSCKTVLI